MRIVALIGAALALATPAAVYAGKPAPPTTGSFSLAGGRGTVIVKGKGALLVRVGRGSAQILDLTPGDRWGPIVNGVVQGPRANLRGEGLSFRVLGGAYRIAIRGEDISLSATGKGVVQIVGEPDALGSAGTYAADQSADCSDERQQCAPVGATPLRIVFGPRDDQTRTPSPPGG